MLRTQAAALNPRPTECSAVPFPQRPDQGFFGEQGARRGEGGGLREQSDFGFSWKGEESKRIELQPFSFFG